MSLKTVKQLEVVLLFSHSKLFILGDTFSISDPTNHWKDPIGHILAQGAKQ